MDAWTKEKFLFSEKIQARTFESNFFISQKLAPIIFFSAKFCKCSSFQSCKDQETSCLIMKMVKRRHFVQF